MTNNLDRTEVLANQDQKEVPINESDAILDAYGTEPLTLDFASADITITNIQWTQRAAYVCTNVTSPRLLNTPLKKGYKFINNTAGASTVTVIRGSTNLVIPAGENRLVYQDGTTNGLQNAGGGGGVSTIAVQEGGSAVVAQASAVNYAAADFDVTDEGSGVAGVALAAGVGSVDVREAGSSVVANATGLNFAGADFDITNEGSNVAGIALAAGAGSSTTQLNVGADILVSSQTFTNVVAINVAEFNPVAGESYYAVLEVKVSVDDAQLRLRVSINNGLSFRTANYNFISFFEASNITAPGNTIKTHNVDQGALITLTSDQTNEGIGFDNAENGMFVIELGELGRDDTYKQIYWTGSYNNFGGHTVGVSGAGAHRLDVGTDASGNDPINAFQISPDSGNISGRISLYKRSTTSVTLENLPVPHVHDGALVYRNTTFATPTGVGTNVEIPWQASEYNDIWIETINDLQPRFWLGAPQSFADTAITTGTNNINISGHALETGMGPYTFGDGGGTAPTTSPTGELDNGDLVWIIRVDANTIRLATSYANAIAGTAINITAAGSGTFDIDGSTRFHVPAGISKVRLQGSVAMDVNFLDLRRDISLVKNGTLLEIGALAGVDARNEMHLTTASAPINVVAGDYFELRYSDQDSVSRPLTLNRTWFSIEVVEAAGFSFSAGVELEDEGTAVANTPHARLNFVGAGVTVTDVDGTEATITIPGGGGGGGGGAVSVVQSQGVSAVSSVDFININPQAGETFFAVASGIVPSTDDANFLCRVSTDNGTVFQSTNYDWTTRLIASGGGEQHDGSGITGGFTTSISLTGSSSGFGMGNATNESGTFKIELGELARTDAFKLITYIGGHTAPNVSQIRDSGSGGWQGGASAVNAIQFLMDSGTFSGRITLYRRSTAPGVATTSEVLWVEDEKTAGTDGGSASPGSYITRDLNTIRKNTITGASVTSNVITLPAGIYRVFGGATGYDTGAHKARLRNTTDNITLIVGTNGSSDQTQPNSIESVIRGEFTLTVTKTIELQHRVAATASPTASETLGRAANLGEPEVYSTLLIEKVG